MASAEERLDKIEEQIRNISGNTANLVRELDFRFRQLEADVAKLNEDVRELKQPE